MDAKKSSVGTPKDPMIYAHMAQIMIKVVGLRKMTNADLADLMSKFQIAQGVQRDRMRADVIAGTPYYEEIDSISEELTRRGHAA